MHIHGFNDILNAMFHRRHKQQCELDKNTWQGETHTTYVFHTKKKKDGQTVAAGQTGRKGRSAQVFEDVKG